MQNVEDLIKKLEAARIELDIALEHESKLRTQSNKAINNAIIATKNAAEAAQDVLNCKNAKEMVFLEMKKTEKAHYARLFSAIARDATYLAHQAQKENAKIFLEVKKIAETLAFLLNDDFVDSQIEPTG
jgi:hypothetical protein